LPSHLTLAEIVEIEDFENLSWGGRGFKKHLVDGIPKFQTTSQNMQILYLWRLMGGRRGALFFMFVFG
jgi:hypothetical protein